LDLFFHVREIMNPDFDLDPSNFFQVAETEEGDFIVPHDSTNIYAFQWGKIKDMEGMHLFVFVEEQALCQVIPYNQEED